MQRLCVLLTMGACLVTSTPQDVAMTVQLEAFHIELTSSELTQLHMCMCKDAHRGCLFRRLHNTSSTLEASAYASSTQYLNVYVCTLYASFIDCSRNTQNGQKRVDVQRKNNSFSLHNSETCDISCVDVMWDDSDTNVTLYTNKTNAKLCPVKSMSDQPAMTRTTTVIIIVASCLIIIIISVIITICVCVKRKSQAKNPDVYTVKSQTCSYREVDKNCGLYAVSPSTSWDSNPIQDKEQEPLYFEVEKDNLDPQEVRESIQIESNNLYSQLHDKTENVMNEYDILPR